MKRFNLLVMSLLVLGLCSCFFYKKEVFFDVDQNLEYCNTQLKKSLNKIFDRNKMPRNILSNQTSWNLVPICIEEWTVGFWPGILWYNYEFTHDEKDKEYAVYYTELLEPLTKLPAYDHDLGFQVFCSYGNGYRLTGNNEYKQIVLNAADTLATLFNDKVGTILSWPREIEPNNWPHNTIMDNIMNLEMLYWAAQNGGSLRLYDIATLHAETTMEYGFDEEGSNYHVVVYDNITGEFIKAVTHQGYSDSSMWARGQAWAIYGYTVVYRETRNKKFLDFAEKVTDLYLSRLPEDEFVPFWDFDAPNIPDEPKDASAAAITASALIELSQLVYDEKKSEKYFNAATAMLIELSSNKYKSGHVNSAFLLHSTGHWPNNSEIDASINYADYYYIEALMKYKKALIKRNLDKFDNKYKK